MPTTSVYVLKLLCRLALGVLCFLGTPLGLGLGLGLCLGQALGEHASIKAERWSARRKAAAHP